MPTPKWRKIPAETWKARIEALACSRQIRAHVACIAWWDLALHHDIPSDWLKPLRDEYDEWAKEDRNALAAALVSVGYPPDVARRRAFKDILAGYIPKKRSASPGDTSAR